MDDLTEEEKKSLVYVKENTFEFKVAKNNSKVMKIFLDSDWTKPLPINIPFNQNIDVVALAPR